MKLKGKKQHINKKADMDFIVGQDKLLKLLRWQTHG